MRGWLLGSSKSSGTRKQHTLLSYDEVIKVVPSAVLKCELSHALYGAESRRLTIGRSYKRRFSAGHDRRLFQWSYVVDLSCRSCSKPRDSALACCLPSCPMVNGQPTCLLPRFPTALIGLSSCPLLTLGVWPYNLCGRAEWNGWHWLFFLSLEHGTEA